MKVFISADMEGLATTSTWGDCDPANPAYQRHTQEMTDEVLAACEGAFRAGATEIVVRDAHDNATNIDPLRLPPRVKLLRGWSGHPYQMVDGIDSTFDAAMFIGYHSPAGASGNALSHTISTRQMYIKLNGRDASEFMLHSYVCALEGVPCVFLSGDKALCEMESGLHPKLVTLPVKEGIGGVTRVYSPAEVHQAIREQTEKALRQDLSGAVIQLPAHFTLEICYKDHAQAMKVSYYPGVKRISNTTVVFETDSYFEVKQALSWII